jgi:hypothetical protein
MGKSKVKVMLVFFYDQGLICYEFVPEGHVVNKEMYVRIHHHLRDAVRRKHPEKMGMKQLVFSA